MSRKKWVVAQCDRDLAAQLAENCGIDPFAAYMLAARGFTDDFEVESFLFDGELCDAFLLPDMQKAVDCINSARDGGDRITVFGDYDCDGVTATALLYSYLRDSGANVDWYIPDRALEGYGMHNGAIDVLRERGTKLIVTVDNGISSVGEVEYAHSLGMEVVITDHHRAGEVLPAAAAVVDPHIEGCDCDFEDWAGVGVAFKLVCALDGDISELLSRYSDLVAIGTVADIVPLKGENRILVREGVGFMNDALRDGTLRPGIKALVAESGGAFSEFTSTVTAFRLAPRINAAGRMGSAERAINLLLETDSEKAGIFAAEISQANAERQSIESEIAAAAIKQISENPSYKTDSVIVVDGEGWHQGVIGIVASRLVEKYGKPAIVISRSGENAKGSGRSVDGLSLYDALAACGEVLTQFGGHLLAAGMSLKTADIPEFRRRINEYAARLNIPMQQLLLDCKLNPASVSLSMLNTLSVLEPFGAENPQPLFGIFNVTISSVQPVSSGKHLRIVFTKKGVSSTAMLFSKTAEEFPFMPGDKVDLAVRLAKNEYMGEQKVSLHIKDIRFSSTDEETLQASQQLYERFCRGEALSKSECAALLPDRTFCAAIYKYIKNLKGWHHDAEILLQRLGFPRETLGKCLIALDMFTQLGFMTECEGGYTLPETAVKAPLESSEIYKRLAGDR